MSDSSVTLNDPKELSKNSQYSFSLRAPEAMPANTLFQIEYTLDIFISTVPDGCLSSTGACLMVPNICLIGEALSSDYTDLNSFINFDVMFANPSEVIQYSTLNFLVRAVSQDLSAIYHASNISLSNSGYYEPHPLGDLSLSGSNITVTNTAYAFAFNNTGYDIPSGSSIQIQFPNALQLLSTEIFTVFENLSPSSYIVRSSPNIDIMDAFPTGLSADQIIRFELGYVLNPYQTGDTDTFNIIIYHTTLTFKYFINYVDIKQQITTTAHFASVTITPDDLTTGLITSYTFDITLGDGYLNSSHSICIQTPIEININCDINTLAPITSGLNIGNRQYIAPKNYSFSIISGTITANSMISVRMQCRNPYTTRPTEFFHIEAVTAIDRFYLFNQYMADMTTPNTFSSLTATPTNIYPKYSSNIEFSITATHPDPITSAYINRIVINIPNLMSIEDPTITVLSGISGITTVSTSGHDIILSDFDRLSQTFGFILSGIRNPISTSILSYEVSTQHTEGYIGEIATTNTYSIRCNFPCRTCSGGFPDLCESCSPSGHEAFTGGNNNYILYVNRGECLDSCPAHTYIIISPQPVCVDCDENCNECDGDPQLCTKCYPNQYLYDNRCQLPPCPLGYIENDQLWMCIRIFHSDTSISLGTPRELATKSTYLFSLRPTSALPSDAVFRVEIPPELNLYGIFPGICDSDKGTCSIVGIGIAELRGILSDPYVDLSTYITFTLGLGNPELPIKIFDLSANVQSKSSDLLTIYHQSVIALSSNTNSNNYHRHDLAEVSIIGESAKTVTNTTYTFKFENKDYFIPAGAKICVRLPDTMELLSLTPTITNSKNILSIPIVSTDGIYLWINGGFETDLSANKMIEFTLSHILNPYKTGPTDPFLIYIIFGPDEYYRLFGHNSTFVDIATISEFPLLSITPSTLKTNDPVNYRFILETGDGRINSSHRISFSTTEQTCDLNTLTSTGFSFSNKYIIEEIYYTIEISSIINEHSTIQFDIICRNPPTTRPTNGFTLSAWYSPSTDEYDIFYAKKEYISDMNILGNFVSVTLSLDNYVAYTENNIIIDVESAIACDQLDQIVLTFPDQIIIPIPGYTITTLNLTGLLIYDVVGQTIIISGITQVNNIYRIKLGLIRNPPESRYPINVNIVTQHRDGYFGENWTTPSYYTSCNYPCKTCPPAEPTSCSSCNTFGDEVFTYTGVNSYLLYIDMSKCVDVCPIHTYNNTDISCRNCHPFCHSCVDLSSKCTKCYPNVNRFLDKETSQCINPPCPAYFGPDESVWECVRNIYIYIYIYVACSAHCTSCNNETSTGCTECEYTYLWLKTFECIEFCPSGSFYNATEHECQCIVFHSICYYVIIKREETQLYLYLYLYIACDTRCAGCVGSSNLDCLMCSSDIGVELFADQSCVCRYGYYFAFYPLLHKLYCQGIFINKIIIH